MPTRTPKPQSRAINPTGVLKKRGSDWDYEEETLKIAHQENLTSIIPDAFKHKPGLTRKFSLWYAAVRYIDHLKGTSTPTLFDSVKLGDVPYLNKSDFTREVLNSKIPAKYRDANRKGMLGTLIPQWAAAYIKDLIAEKQSKDEPEEHKVNQKQETNTHLDEDGIMENMAELQELLPSTKSAVLNKDDPGQLIALAELKIKEWTEARQAIKKFLERDHKTDIYELNIAILVLRRDFAKEARRAGKLNAKTLLRLAKKVKSQVMRARETMGKVQTWFEADMGG